MLLPSNNILFMDTTRSLSALRSYTRPEAATVHSDWRPQHLTWYIETIYSPRLPQYIVTRYIEAIYSQGCHGTLWLKATTFDRIHRGYLQPEVATVYCDWSPQHLIGLIEAIDSPWLPQFIVNKGHNSTLKTCWPKNSQKKRIFTAIRILNLEQTLWYVAVRLFTSESYHSSF